MTARAAPANPLLQRLRERTADEHDRLEATVAIEPTLRDRARYRRLLERFWGFYAPLEQVLAQVEWPMGAARPATVPKTPLLERDLACLDAREREAGDREAGASARATPPSLPVCDRLPEIGDWRAALGCHYVLEGATLGGHVIAKMIADAPDVVEDLPTAFFSPYGDDTGQRWRQFCGVLQRLSDDGDALVSAPATAEATFRCLERWLRD